MPTLFHYQVAEALEVTLKNTCYMKIDTLRTSVSDSITITSSTVSSRSVYREEGFYSSLIGLVLDTTKAPFSPLELRMFCAIK